jgi:hypothetical protein
MAGYEFIHSKAFARTSPGRKCRVNSVKNPVDRVSFYRPAILQIYVMLRSPEASL